jgi:hypothetical protein
MPAFGHFRLKSPLRTSRGKEKRKADPLQDETGKDISALFVGAVGDIMFLAFLTIYRCLT